MTGGPRAGVETQRFLEYSYKGVDACRSAQIDSLFLSAIVIITTVGNEEQAKGIAGELVASRRAACVNIVPIACTIYRWQGKVCEDSEFLLVIKTLDSEYEAVEATILELHEYEVPEILSFNVRRGSEAFLSWIADSVSGGEVAEMGAWPASDE